MKKILKNIQNFISREARQFKKFYQEYAVKAILLAERLKEALDNPQLDIIVHLTETKVDDTVLAAFRRALKIITGLSSVNKDNYGKILEEFLIELRKQSVPVQQANLAKIAALVSKELAFNNGIHLTHNEADVLVNLAYNSYKEGVLK